MNLENFTKRILDFRATQINCSDTKHTNYDSNVTGMHKYAYCVIALAQWKKESGTAYVSVWVYMYDAALFKIAFQ